MEGLRDGLEGDGGIGADYDAAVEGNMESAGFALHIGAVVSCQGESSRCFIRNRSNFIGGILTNKLNLLC